MNTFTGALLWHVWLRPLIAGRWNIGRAWRFLCIVLASERPSRCHNAAEIEDPDEDRTHSQIVATHHHDLDPTLARQSLKAVFVASVVQVYV